MFASNGDVGAMALVLDVDAIGSAAKSLASRTSTSCRSSSSPSLLMLITSSFSSIRFISIAGSTIYLGDRGQSRKHISRQFRESSGIITGKCACMATNVIRRPFWWLRRHSPSPPFRSPKTWTWPLSSAALPCLPSFCCSGAVS